MEPVKRLNAFFPFFGGKHNLSKWYPAPERANIIEAFAGSAGYAHRYWDRQVHLNDIDPIIVGVWRFLIGSRPEDILALPLLEPEQLVSELPVCQEAKWLIGFWCYRGAAEPRNKLASWAAQWPNRFWSAHIRATIASQVDSIRHWTVSERPAFELLNAPVTWFIDPPYSNGGAGYRKSDIDFVELRSWVLQLDGQVIVCERVGADWLPGITATKTQRTQRRSVTARGQTDEVFWHRSSLTDPDKAA